MNMTFSLMGQKVAEKDKIHDKKFNSKPIAVQIYSDEKQRKMKKISGNKWLLLFSLF